MEDLINHAAVLFDDVHPAGYGSQLASVSGSTKSVRPNSVIFPTTHNPIPTSLPTPTIPTAPLGPASEAPLPVVPAEPPVSADYGSSFTRITSLPPRSTPSTSTAPGVPSADFTPALPTRPQHSIHPSRRNNASTGDDRPAPPSRVASIREEGGMREQEEDEESDLDTPLSEYATHSLRAASIRDTVDTPASSPTKSTHAAQGKEDP